MRINQGATKHALRHPLEGGLAALADARLRIDPLGTVERKRIVEGLFHEGDRRTPFLHRFYALMTLSVLIAVLGLLADSTAVVIGAMLVAPLMAPVLGVAAALVMDWNERALRSLWTTVTGAVLAVALAAAVSWILPGDPQPLPNELLARTSPRLVDLGVALVAGSAGAYSHVRKQAGDAIVGVAVAVALVPPLAVIGITLQLGEWQMVAGSFLLFLANVIGIITAGALTFILFGLVPNGRLFETRQPIARRLRQTVIATVLVVAPLQIIDEWRPTPIMSSAPGQALVTDVVNSWRADVRIISVAVEDIVDEREAPTVHLTLASSAPADEPLGVDLLSSRISEAFGSSVNLVVTSVESNVETASTTIEEPEPATDLSPLERKGE
ncbi:MAG: TIGR00341 family protein [Acidimicrobiales bacterium]